MNTRNQLQEMQRLVKRLQDMVEELIEVQPKPTDSEPPPMRRRNAWNALRKALLEKHPLGAEFTATELGQEAEKIAGKNQGHWSDSHYSSILSSWAKNGWLELVEEGSGRRPSRYRRKKRS